MNTMLFFRISSEIEAIRVIFNYYHLKLLTNPECSFVSNADGLHMSDTYGSAQKRMPATWDASRFIRRPIKSSLLMNLKF